MLELEELQDVQCCSNAELVSKAWHLIKIIQVDEPGFVDITRVPGYESGVTDLNIRWFDVDKEMRPLYRLDGWDCIGNLRKDFKQDIVTALRLYYKHQEDGTLNAIQLHA